MIIDTSLAAAVPSHKQALTAVSDGPVRAIILTHAHADQGGIALWKQAGTQMIAHRSYAEFVEYTTRLGGYFARMNAAQFRRRAWRWRAGIIREAARGAGNAGRALR